ncbi:MAG: hypothetical protein NTW19_13160 [Planctomycetota bacterium]|nr:hypothetical protein [Planctomycetota bacterium]
MDYQRPVATWSEFLQRWGGLHNFLMAGELCGGFDFPLPPLDELVDRARGDANTIFRSGVKQAEFDLTNIPDAKTMPIDKLLARPFILANFSIVGQFGGPGQLFEGLDERWVEPWRQRLRDHGFTFESVFAILFASGPHSATNYHMDYTHQLAWQRWGTKHFHGLKDPDRWTTRELRGKCELKGMTRPAAVGADDVFTLVQPPGTVLWNAITTPHWVETFDEPAATLTLVHSGLRVDGKLCPHAQEIADYRAEVAAAAKPEAKTEAKPEAARY